MSKKSDPGVLKEGWAEMPPKAKPSKALSTDPSRPVLQHGHIDHRKDGSFLCMTDAYVMVELPLAIQCPKNERENVLPAVGLIPQALKSLDRSSTGRFRIKGGLCEVEGDPALYPVIAALNPPSFKELVPEGWAKDGEGIGRIGFNPKFMARAAEALGVSGRGWNHSVKVSFIGPLRPMLIEPLATIAPAGTRALLMPVRLGGE